MIPGDFCQTVDSVTHYSHKLFIVPIFVNTAKCCIKGEHKVKGKVLRGLVKVPVIKKSNTEKRSFVYIYPVKFETN